MDKKWNAKIFSVTDRNFEELALEIFRFQYNNSAIYRRFVQALQAEPVSVQRLDQIPFLPIRFFKSHAVQSGEFEPKVIFESSGITGSENSHHLIRDIALYEESFIKSFEMNYSPVNEYCIIGLLPSYIERKNSSLVYMAEKLIRLSGHAQSGFYLDDFDKLISVINELEKRQQKTLLIGVTFALLDLAEKYAPDSSQEQLHNTIIIETGGMKGRRQEMIRQELHEYLKMKFRVNTIHSEYGMTELLSQAYSRDNGVFNCPPWMKVLVRDEEDPLLISVPRFQTVAPITGTINVIDLANIYSCSFIATDDVGKLYPGGSFEMLGRMDNSDLRGCSLMVM